MNSEKPLPFRILFVCMGNICRSPAADIVLRRLVAEAGLEERIEIDSAGTIEYHTGRAPDERMADALSARGYDVQGKARQVRPEDFEHFDLVVPMDQKNEADLRGVFCPDPALESKIRPFAGFCTRHDIDHVPDPYLGGREGFEQVADIVEDGCRGVLEYAIKQLE